MEKGRAGKRLPEHRKRLIDRCLERIKKQREAHLSGMRDVTAASDGPLVRAGVLQGRVVVLTQARHRGECSRAPSCRCKTSSWMKSILKWLFHRFVIRSLVETVETVWYTSGPDLCRSVPLD